MLGGDPERTLRFTAGGWSPVVDSVRLDGMGPVDTYVRQLSRAVGGGGVLTRSAPPVIVGEAYDHLLDATEAWEARGLSRLDAERRAIDEFGDLDELAPGYRSVVALGTVRRTAWMLVVTMMIQPFVWDVGRAHPEDPPVPGILKASVEMVGGTLIASGLLMVLLTFLGVRWWGARAWMVRCCAATMGVGAVLLTAMAIAMSVSGDRSALDVLLVGTFVFAPMAFVLQRSVSGWRQVRGTAERA